MPEATDGQEKILVAVLTGWDRASPSDYFSKDDVHYEGNNDLWRLIDKTACHWVRYHIGPGYLRQSRRWNMLRPDVVLNLISDVDENRKTLGLAQRLTAPIRDRLINDPANIRRTGREDVSRALPGIPNLIVPKSRRLRRASPARLHTLIEKENVQFPVIVRRPGTHTGRTVALCETPDDLAQRLEGVPSDYILTELVDNQWSDGLYRKMRLFYLGGEVILRHVLISDTWSIHGAARGGLMKERKELRDEERRYFEGGEELIMERASAIIKEAARRLRLDYFGMDCGPTEDGQFVLFEANATMNIVGRTNNPLYQYARGGYAVGQEALRRLLLLRAKTSTKSRLESET